MHNHFDKNLDLKALILERHPALIVECGAGQGDLTRQIASLLDVYDFRFVVISDKAVEGLDPRIEWKVGLSYEALADFKDNSLDLCIIDTDHNYWTLMKELSAVFLKMREGSFIALHDVETFYHDTGMALSYWDGKPYPKEEIEKHATFGSLGDAVIAFLSLQKLYYKLHSWNHESHGAALLERKTQTHFNIVVPGPEAIFSKKETDHAGV